MSSAQAAHALSLFCKSTLPARNSFGLLPQGYCEQKTPKCWKDSVLSVLLLIYAINYGTHGTGRQFLDWSLNFKYSNEHAVCSVKIIYFYATCKTIYVVTWCIK